jgi:hypothetical protein
MTITRKGIIRLSVVCSDGTTGGLTTHEVLHAHTMCISPLPVPVEARERISITMALTTSSTIAITADIEAAYTPGIDKILTFLLAGDEL